jgi:hypothetical protein
MCSNVIVVSYVSPHLVSAFLLDNAAFRAIRDTVTVWWRMRMGTEKPVTNRSSRFQGNVARVSVWVGFFDLFRSIHP